MHQSLMPRAQEIVLLPHYGPSFWRQPAWKRQAFRWLAGVPGFSKELMLMLDGYGWFGCWVEANTIEYVSHRGEQSVAVKHWFLEQDKVTLAFGHPRIPSIEASRYAELKKILKLLKARSCTEQWLLYINPRWAASPDWTWGTNCIGMYRIVHFVLQSLEDLSGIDLYHFIIVLLENVTWKSSDGYSP